MTYREAIQQLQVNIDKAYEAAEVLRDHADLWEKEYWNNFRGHSSNAMIELSKLDNRLSNERASMNVTVPLKLLV